MRKIMLLLILLFPFFAHTQSGEELDVLKTSELKNGFIPYHLNKEEGKVYFEISELETEFLYQTALATGVGSNDIGLDRGQLSSQRVVKFQKLGNKLLLIQVNYKFRAESDNLQERKSVKEAFAESVLWGFPILGKVKNNYIIDASEFLLRDVQNVAKSLEYAKQGSYHMDASRSALYFPSFRNFPKNTELEALITLEGSPKGNEIYEVAPDAKYVSVRQHHSFIELPGKGYEKRVYDPRCGMISIDYQDYASPIGTPLVKEFIIRHRLEKKDPNADLSEAVKPIIYYLDPGAPEPVRSALLDGARWWNQAFEAAGYINAFQVKILPEDADPLDVRFNTIQWVHRSTRGWSYGDAVVDPRTGEIIKGHVSLGSLRVRQDYLIAQGIATAEVKEGEKNPMLELALARIRQLSAHEVGHTIGLMHNFSASVNNRASVMDYPHPLIEFNSDGSPNLEKAYAIGIGDWDKRTVLYAYQDFSNGVNETEALQAILVKTEDLGLKYISDRDARPVGGAHPTAHLWDGGKNSIQELIRISKVRKQGMENFGLHVLPKNTPLSTLQDVYVPLYLSHRYQVQAVAKLIGGVNYNYSVIGDGNEKNTLVDYKTQKRAVVELIKTLDASFLSIPEKTIELMTPEKGMSRSRERFPSKTGLIFDPLSAAETSAQHVLKYMLHPQRISRLAQQEVRGKKNLSLKEMLTEMRNSILDPTKFDHVISKRVAYLYVLELVRAFKQENTSPEAKAVLHEFLFPLKYVVKKTLGEEQISYFDFLKYTLREAINNPDFLKSVKKEKMPDGSPIGTGCYQQID